MSDDIILTDDRIGGELPWHKQWAWKKFIEVVTLFLLFFVPVSCPITYILVLGLLRYSHGTALIYTFIHLFIGLGIFLVDIVRSVLSVASRRYLYGFWFDSLEDFWFRASEVKSYREISIGKNNPSGSILFLPREEEGKGVKNITAYRMYHAILPDLEKSERLILVPKKYKWHEALREHRESVPFRYPIAVNVSYGCFVKLLEVDYEGIRLPIYELRVGSGMTKDLQADLPWMYKIGEELPVKALKGFDIAYGTQERLKRENLEWFTKSLKEAYDEKDHYAHTIADESIKQAERTLLSERSEFDLSWFSKHKWKIIFGTALIIIIILLYSYLVPYFTTSTPTPPS